MSYYREILDLYKEWLEENDKQETDPNLNLANELRAAVECAILDGAEPEQFVAEMITGVGVGSLAELMDEFVSWPAVSFDDPDPIDLAEERQIELADRRNLLLLLNQPKDFDLTSG